MDALILGAGYATRLYPLTKTRPKPLLPVGGIPILERICLQIVKTGMVDRIHIVTNHTFAESYESWLQDWNRRHPGPPAITIHDDRSTNAENRLGAIGDLQFVIDRAGIQEDLLVMAGDNLIEGDLSEFLRFAATKGAAVGLKDFEDDQEKVSLYGVVELDQDRRVIGFEEKPRAPKSTLVAVGLYFFPRWTIPLVGKYLAAGHSKDAPGYYLQWLHRQTPVYGFALPGHWFDIGDPDSYHRADEQMTKMESAGRR